MQRTIRIGAEDLDFLLHAAGIAPDSQVARVMVLCHVEGYTDAAIAAELAVSESRVRGYRSEGWTLIREHEQATGIDLVEVLHEVVEQLRDFRDDSDVVSVRRHVKDLLRAMGGPPRHNPTAPLVDDVGRKAANHDPLVDVDDVLDCRRPPLQIGADRQFF